MNHKKYICKLIDLLEQINQFNEKNKKTWGKDENI
jgi:hypothetical protein